MALFNVSSALVAQTANTGKLIKKWRNPTTNPNFDLCDMSVQMGLFFLVNTVAPPAPTTQMIKLIDGTVAKRLNNIPVYQLGVSEVDTTIYGINGGKNGGNSEYINIDLGAKPPLCLVFNYAVGKCARCVKGYRVLNGGTPTFPPGKDVNNIANSIVCVPGSNLVPGGLMNTTSYSVELEDGGAGYARIIFNDLKEFPPEVKK